MDKKNLDSLFTGRVILPVDKDYDKMRQVFYGGLNKKPAIIVCVANAKDIVSAINLAKKHKIDLAVRSGGHSVAGYSTTDGGIVVDLREMKKINIDKSAKTVWAETGLLAKELTDELDKHNFVLGFGDTGSVGIGGITLGGGVGFLVRKFGLAIDNLLAAEIVTADGQILTVDETNHPDLFWALRGGGGNFGIVTKFKYKLNALGDCYGGVLMLPATPKVIASFISLAKKASDNLSTIINIMPTFPLPFVQEKYHGKLSIMALMVYAGNPKDGEKAFAPFKALATPYADMTKPMRYKDIFFPEDESYHPTAISRNLHLHDVNEDLAQTAIDWLAKIEAPIKAFQLRVLGGAMAKVPEANTAYANRHQAIMANIAVFYESDKEKPVKQKWVDNFSDAISQNDSSAYVGFLGPNDQNRIHDVYPAKTLKKLQIVKAKYDPTNFFKLNFNIPPNKTN